MSIKDPRDFEGLRAAGLIVRACLSEMRSHARPGVTTAELNARGAEVLRRSGARSAPMLVYGFPAEFCISVNDECVHGIPSWRVLRAGDLLKLDVTVEKDGYMADAAITLGVGPIAPEHQALIDCAQRAFDCAMRTARAGGRVHDIGRAVENEVRGAGFSVLRDLTGHGIGRTIHEAPAVPNYFDRRARTLLTPGLVLAIEPIITTGDGRSIEAADGWTVKTADGSPAAHYEQTIVITENEPALLTAA